MFISLQSRGLRHTRLVCPPLSELAQIHVCWVDDTIQPLRSLLLWVDESLPAQEVADFWVHFCFTFLIHSDICFCYPHSLSIAVYWVYIIGQNSRKHWLSLTVCLIDYWVQIIHDRTLLGALCVSFPGLLKCHTEISDSQV